VPADLRTNNATVRDLLGMTNKWGSDKTFDPFLESGIVSNALGRTTPVSCIDTIRYMLKLPLDRSPDPQYASNYEYCILGRIVEEASGQRYEDYVKSAVLLPLGITRMQIGHTTLAGRAPGEVRKLRVAGSSPAAPTNVRRISACRPYLFDHAFQSYRNLQSHF
jgi:CubicO group peptidase (beta-lactamase class C family)